MEYLIKTRSIGGMTEEQFFRFCQENDSIHFERNAMGDIVVMEPTGSETDLLNVNVVTDLANWNRQTGSGYVFGSNAGFTLPNKAVRSPDGAFIGRLRYEALPHDDRKKFAHICPDFIIEILSQSDEESALQEKMKEWMENGCRLAWMINPIKKETIIFSQGGGTETRPFYELLTGEDVLPGFVLDLRKFYTL